MANIHNLYRFIVCNHEPGDELYVFCFSRGACTVRMLVGFLNKVGLLLTKKWDVCRSASDHGVCDFAKRDNVLLPHTVINAYTGAVVKTSSATTGTGKVRESGAAKTKARGYRGSVLLDGRADQKGSSHGFDAMCGC